MVKLPGLPKTKRGTVLTIGGSLVVVAVVALALVYFVLFPTSSPKPFSLNSATATTTVGTGTQLSGRWTIGSGSEAGYRVREKLGFLPAQSDAVGRTSAITGEATVTEVKRIVTVRAASFVVAVNTLKSDRSMRDQRIHTIGLQSDTYPKSHIQALHPNHPSRERADRPRGPRLRDRGGQHPRDFQTRDRPAADEPLRFGDQCRGIAHVPLERIQHDRPERRRVRERHRQNNDGVRPTPPALVGARSTPL
jgi:hypothetical protein